MTAASAVVWLELGLGLFLLFAPHGRWSRSAGAISGVWGFAIWVFGEAFGGVFGHGLTWVLGAPGAALFYVVAGALVALPERAWTRPRLGRGIVTFMSSFFIAMAVLQAWPGRGFWQGHIRGGRVTGTLTGTIEHLSRTRQPGILSSWVGSFASFDASHGWGVNLLIVVALAGIGTGLLSRNPRIVRWTVAGAIVMCLADWVLIEDLGFLGGVGTNPNSMIPIAFVLGAGYLALVRVPVETGTGSLAQSAHSASSGGWWAFLYPQNVFRAMAALGATAIIAFGALPMALASFNPNADPILAEAFDGPPSITNAPAVPFDLVDQHNQPVSLTSLRGKTLAITFLDPVCTSDCPLIAREFRQTDTMLGAAARRVDFIAIVANPIYRSTADTRAFDQQEGLTAVKNWLFLTGSVQALHHVWNAYGAEVYTVPAGSMVAHAELTFVIDGHGRTRVIMGEDQDPGETPQSSFSVLLEEQIKNVLHS